MVYLEEERKKKQKEVFLIKRQLQVEEFDELKVKKKRFESEVVVLVKFVDDYFVKVESIKNIDKVRQLVVYLNSYCSFIKMKI